MTDQAPIRFAGVHKEFDGVAALRDVSLTIPDGAIVGLIGRNGSGKSTLLHHVTGWQLPTAGVVHTLGVATPTQTHTHMERIGVVQQHSAFPDHLRVGGLVRFVRSLHRRWDDALEAQLLQRFELDPSSKVGTLSPGTRQRLAWLLALCHHPTLLLLDEPFADLDPTMRRTVLDLLIAHCADDRPTVLLSSHLLHDIEPVITHVLAIEGGRVTTFEEIDVLKTQYGANLETLFPTLIGATDTPMTTAQTAGAES
jgi:ABC-2 type transport system ATP-binding protein